VAYFDIGAATPSHGATWWGHAAPNVLIGAILTSIALVLWPLPPGSAASLVIPVVLVGVVLTSWVAMRQHDRRICEFCMAAMPINPSEAAARFRNRLALAHLGANRRATAAYLLVLVGSSVLLAIDSGPAGRAAWAVIQSTMIYLVLAYSTHRKLQPWCPQCNGGGDGVDAPDPVPSGSERG
jgi:hypothetical protein